MELKVFGSRSEMIQAAGGRGWMHKKSRRSGKGLGILALCQQKLGLPRSRFFPCSFWHLLQEEQE